MIFVFCLPLSTKVDPLENFPTFYNMQSVSSNAVAEAISCRVQQWTNAFTNYFTANTYVSMADFVNAVVDRYGVGWKAINFIWSNANQGYIRIGSTDIMINGNIIFGNFQYFKTGYDWTRSNFFITDISNSKVYMVDISRNTTNITTNVFPLN